MVGILHVMMIGILHVMIGILHVMMSILHVMIGILHVMMGILHVIYACKLSEIFLDKCRCLKCRHTDALSTAVSALIM